jgi:hypothetical protein
MVGPPKMRIAVVREVTSDNSFAQLHGLTSRKTAVSRGEPSALECFALSKQAGNQRLLRAEAPPQVLENKG